MFLYICLYHRLEIHWLDIEWYKNKGAIFSKAVVCHSFIKIERISNKGDFDSIHEIKKEVYLIFYDKNCIKVIL